MVRSPYPERRYRQKFAVRHCSAMFGYFDPVRPHSRSASAKYRLRTGRRAVRPRTS